MTEVGATLREEACHCVYACMQVTHTHAHTRTFCSTQNQRNSSAIPLAQPRNSADKKRLYPHAVEFFKKKVQFLYLCSSQ